MKNIFFHTLGCKLNFTETSNISEKFLNSDFKNDNNISPDIFIINTCSVTNNAERECRQIIRRTLKKFPNAFIIVIGCYAQMRSKDIAKIPGVDLILGTREKFDILKYERKFEKYEKPRIFVSESKDDDEVLSADSTFSGRTRAFLKIQDGCDYKCAYCTVPLARGGSRSVPLDIIIEKIKGIARKGFKEVVLTGVNVSDYGKNMNADFFELLKAVDKINEMPRIRISSIEPNILNTEIIDFISNSEKICKHFHIPLQSGDDEVLKLMKRRYNTGKIRELISEINEKIPQAGIGMDIIVGFPNETDERFENTYDLLKNMPFSYLHVFSYSPRPDTPAYSMKRLYKDGSCDLRSVKLRELSLNKKMNFYERFLNKSVEILVEEKKDGNLIFGLTHNYIKVGIPVDNKLINQIAKVRIKGLRAHYCIGEIE